MVQVIVGANTGYGIRMGSRQFWDNTKDDVAYVTVMKETFFVTVAAFAVYLYWFCYLINRMNQEEEKAKAGSIYAGLTTAQKKKLQAKRKAEAEAAKAAETAPTEVKPE